MKDKDERPPKVLEVLEVLENQKQLEHGIDEVVNDSTNTTNTLIDSSDYRYTQEAIETFFDSDNGQQEEHNLEDSICRPLIGQHNYKPFFYYCKDPNVKFLQLKSIEIMLDLKIHKDIKQNY